MEFLYENYHKSLIVYICVGKIIIKVFLISLSPILKVDLFWFWFG